jgi:hypothetical protein
MVSEGSWQAHKKSLQGFPAGFGVLLFYLSLVIQPTNANTPQTAQPHKQTPKTKPPAVTSATINGRKSL